MCHTQYPACDMITCIQLGPILTPAKRSYSLCNSNTIDFDSKGPRFKSRLQHQLSYSFLIFLSLSKQIPEYYITALPSKSVPIHRHGVLVDADSAVTSNVKSNKASRSRNKISIGICETTLHNKAISLEK